MSIFSKAWKVIKSAFTNLQKKFWALPPEVQANLLTGNKLMAAINKGIDKGVAFTLAEIERAIPGLSKQQLEGLVRAASERFGFTFTSIEITIAGLQTKLAKLPEREWMKKSEEIAAIFGNFLSTGNWFDALMKVSGWAYREFVKPKAQEGGL